MSRLIGDACVCGWSLGWGTVAAILAATWRFPYVFVDAGQRDGCIVFLGGANGVLVSVNGRYGFCCVP